MLIIVLCIIVLYCIIGYVWNVRKSIDQDWKDVKSNTPHLEFWCMIPKLTWTGCCVSKDWIVGKYHQYRGDGGGGASELITSGGDDDDV